MRKGLLAALCCMVALMAAGCGARPSVEGVLAAAPAQATEQPQEAPAPPDEPADGEIDWGEEPERAKPAETEKPVGPVTDVSEPGPMQALLAGGLAVGPGDPVSMVLDFYPEEEYIVEDEYSYLMLDMGSTVVYYGEDGLITEIDMYEGSEGRCMGGVAVGSSLDELLAAWGEATMVEEYDLYGGYAYYRYEFDAELNQIEGPVEGYFNGDYYADFMVEDDAVASVTLSANYLW